MKPSAKIFLGLSLALLFCACSDVAPDAGFIKTPELLKANDELPFDGIWFKDGVDLRTYKKIYVAPVDTTHLLKMDWWDKLSGAEDFKDSTPEAEAKVLAKYMQDQVKEAFTNEKEHGYTVVEQPDKDTLVIEAAIVEVLPTKVWLNAIGYLAIGALDTGKTAIEARFRDGATNEPVVRLKDLRMGKMAIISIADLEWYAHAKDTIDEWSTDFVDLCKRAPDQSLPSRIPFTLRPW